MTQRAGNAGFSAFCFAGTKKLTKFAFSFIKDDSMRKISNPFAGADGYHCFGCCKENQHGLCMDFYEDGDDVVCFWKPDGDYQGWVNTLHGGIQATLLDETAAWVVFRKMQAIGVTYKLELSYRKPVKTTDTQLTIRGRITRQVRNLVTIELTLENSSAEVCTTATAIYYVYSKEKSEEMGFKGCGIEGEELLF